MNYLSSSDLEIFNVVNDNPKRELTDIEKLVLRISRHDRYYSYSDQASTYRAGLAQEEELLERVGELEDIDKDLKSLMSSAVLSSESLNELLKDYPQVQHYQDINFPSQKGFLGCAFAGVDEARVEAVKWWVNELGAIFDALPTNDIYNVRYGVRFVETPGMPTFRELRNAAINHKEPSFFGIALNKELQVRINVLFSYLTRDILDLLMTYKLWHALYDTAKIHMVWLEQSVTFKDREYMELAGSGRRYRFFIPTNLRS